jgi:hypothetical protein
MIDFTSNPNLSDALEIYTTLGIEAIPLRAGEKLPLVKGWQTRPINRLWRDVHLNVNIGLRAGGPARIAFIDCDDKAHPGTFSTAQRWLAGLGYLHGEYPVVSTASGVGKHIYINFHDQLSGHVRKLTPAFGAGEFRYGSGSFVVAPPSVIKEGNQYQLVAGDLRQIPRIELQDILPILIRNENDSGRTRKISRKTLALLSGKGIEYYASRSEAEQSIIASLVNSGFSFGEILALFGCHPCAGKYAEMRTQSTSNAERWLLLSYNEAVEWTQKNESHARITAETAIAWAESIPWAGRTGAIDQLVFIAHAKIAYKAGRLAYAASCRDLGEHTGINFNTAIRATHRLLNRSLITLEKEAIADSANIYRLGNFDKARHSLTTPVVRKCLTCSNHDAFRQKGLGKSGALIWQVLHEHPASIGELAVITGRHERTIHRALQHMSTLADPLTGEYLPMVASDDGKTYKALRVDLDRIAQGIGTAGAGKRQRQQHAKERHEHRRSLLLGQKRLRNTEVS